MKGKKISTDLKRTILALGDLHTVPEIAALTAVSRRQIYRIRKDWEVTGSVEHECRGGTPGRPRFLSPNEETVSTRSISKGTIVDGQVHSQYVIECVRRTPNVYLEDLQSQIAADLGVKISRKLVWETLRRGGLTLKKASLTYPCHDQQIMYLRLPTLQQNNQLSNGLNMCSICHTGTQKTN